MAGRQGPERCQSPVTGVRTWRTAVTALEELRAVLPEIRFGCVPVRSMDTPHAGFQDRGVYERNIALLYVPDGS